MTSIHPRWTGNSGNGYDAAMMRLPTPINVSTPTFAAPTFDLYPNSKLNGFGMPPNVDATELTVVAKKFCPHLEGSGGNTFCAFPKDEKALPGMSNSLCFCRFYFLKFGQLVTSLLVLMQSRHGLYIAHHASIFLNSQVAFAPLRDIHVSISP